MRLSPRHCPSCHSAFIPWRVWSISRWSSIRCPSCRLLLNRKLDLQFFLVIALLCIVITGALFVLRFSVTASLVVGVFGIAGVWAVDALTVKLVTAGRRISWLRGYEA